VRRTYGAVRDVLLSEDFSPITESLATVQIVSDGKEDFDIRVCSRKKAIREDATEEWKDQENGEHNSVALVRERTVPTERPQLLGEVSVSFANRGLSHSQHDRSPTAVISIFLDRERKRQR
jgi:hypothetical protein